MPAACEPGSRISLTNGTSERLRGRSHVLRELPRIPFAPPEWLPSDVVAAAACAIGAASASPIAIVYLESQAALETIEHRHVIVPALLIAPVLVAWALSTKAPATAIARVLLGGPLAGVIAALFTATITESATDFRIDWLDAAMTGVPFGAAFGIAFVWPIAVASYTLERRGHDAPDMAMAAIGGWLLFTGIFALYGLQATCCRMIGWQPVSLGAVLLSAGMSRVLLRRRWLHRVRSGRVSDWAIEEWHPGQNEVLEPLFTTQPFGCEAALVYLEPSMGDPYRARRNAITVALVPN